MWRAIRLVLDTGIHDMGWSREQAIEYFRANSVKTEQEITSEVDRYIVMPGQALAYKSGELAIVALRAEAERELEEARRSEDEDAAHQVRRAEARIRAHGMAF